MASPPSARTGSRPGSGAEARPLLRDAAFLRLWSGTTASGLATWALPFVLGLAVLDDTLTPGVLGLLLAARTVGFLAAVAVGGVLADRHARRSVVLWSSLAAAASSPLLAAGLGRSDLLMAAAAALAGAGQGACRPAFQALTSEIVDAGRRTRANAALTLAVRGTTLAGPAATALLATVVGTAALLLGIGALWLIAAFVPGRPKTRPADGADGAGAAGADNAAGPADAADADDAQDPRGARDPQHTRDPQDAGGPASAGGTHPGGQGVPARRTRRPGRSVRPVVPAPAGGTRREEATAPQLLAAPAGGEPSPERESPARRRSSLWREFGEGLREARRHPWFMAGLGALAAVAATAYSVTAVVLPVISRDRYGGEFVLAAATTAYTVGALAGALVAARLPARSQGWVALAGLATSGLAPLSLVLPLHAGVVLAAYAVAGAGIELFNVPWFTATQHEMAPDRLARVSSLDFLVSYGLAPVGLALIAPAVAAAGAAPVLLVCAVTCFAAPAAAAFATGARHLSRPRGNLSAAAPDN
ncbi:MFS transporter [Streptomyces zhihengii]|uniref:MFS transporter n=1 Tax=Streptomyces zhihengii TaxID=1818004 RepID=UPI003689A7D0